MHLYSHPYWSTSWQPIAAKREIDRKYNKIFGKKYIFWNTLHIKKDFELKSDETFNKISETDKNVQVMKELYLCI